ncbi:Uncharacterized protein APZ42_011986 [Daphnia magna]|uniref:Uncharacterized protein n=1 Tax=Daphnia magna TaxID=35525 RepID=A0A162SBG1_9CRUS|nr:Uncharacterized protein APZ42_011986 [Daphnia magna]
MGKVPPITAKSAAIMEKAPPGGVVETPTPSSDPDLDRLANKQYIQDHATDRDNELALKFSPCYWTNGFVNFNDKPYAFYKNIEQNIVLLERTLAHSLRYEDVKSFDYDHRSNPAYNDNLLNHMNVVADIVAAMNEHPPSDFSLNHRPMQPMRY